MRVSETGVLGTRYMKGSGGKVRARRRAGVAVELSEVDVDRGLLLGFGGRETSLPLPILRFKM